MGNTPGEFYKMEFDLDGIKYNKYLYPISPLLMTNFVTFWIQILKNPEYNILADGFQNLQIKNNNNNIDNNDSGNGHDEIEDVDQLYYELNQNYINSIESK